MNRFAELLDRLAYEPGRNNKLRFMTEYFRNTADLERGFALAALTGALSFRHAKPSVIRALIWARTDPVLFELSLDYVGDLSETVALMWPAPKPQARYAPSLREPLRAVGRVGVGGPRTCDDNHNAQIVIPPTPDPSPPHAAHLGGGEQTVRAATESNTLHPPSTV